MKSLFITLLIGITFTLSAQDYCGQAAASFKEGKYEDAVKYYNMCMNDNTDRDLRDLQNEVEKAEKCRNLLVKVATLLEINDYPHVVETYRELLTVNPDDPAAKRGIELWKDKSNGNPGAPQIFPPTVSTGNLTAVTANSFTGSGNVANTGGLPVSGRGFCWSVQNREPTVNDDRVVVDGELGDYTGNVTGLLPNRTYYVRAFAQNSAGVAYGRVATVTTVKGKPWTSVRLSGGRDFKNVSSRCLFSNGKHVYVAQLVYGDGGVFQHDPVTGASRKICPIPYIEGDPIVVFWCGQAVVIENIAYMVVYLYNSRNKQKQTYHILRFDMNRNAFLPNIDTYIPSGGGGNEDEVFGGFAVDNKSYFIFRNGGVLAYDTQAAYNNLRRLNWSNNYVGSCTGFSVNNKGYVVYPSGLIEEINTNTGAHREVAKVPDGCSKPYVFTLNGKAYIFYPCTTNLLYEYDPLSGAIKQIALPPVRDGRDSFAILFGADRGFFGINEYGSDGTVNFYLYDPQQENF